MNHPILTGFDPKFLSGLRPRERVRPMWFEPHGVGELPGLGKLPETPGEGGSGECPGEDCNEDALFRECDALCFPCTARVCSVDSERCRLEAYVCNECESDPAVLLA